MKRLLKQVWLIFMPVLFVACSIVNSSQVTPTPALAKTLPAFTSTPKVLPSATPGALKAALDAASKLLNTGKEDEAVVQYLALIQQYPASTPGLDQAYSNLIQIAGSLVKQANELRGKDKSRIMPPEACPVYQKGVDIYQAILHQPEKPKMDLSQFYQDSAQVNFRIVECYQLVEKPRWSNAQIFEMLMTNFELYPANLTTNEIFTSAIVQSFSDMVRSDFEAQPDAVTRIADRILAKIGGEKYGNETVASYVNAKLIDKIVCTGKAVSSPLISSSPDKKIFDCTNFMGSKLDAAGVLAKNPGEIWYALKNEYKNLGEPLQCTESSGAFTYTYQSAYQEIYTIRDLRSGSVIATTTFASTTPRCVFTTCSVNKATKAATCNGGEARSTMDENVFMQWVKGAVH